MQTAADVVEGGAMGSERLRLLVDVGEGKLAGAHGGEQLVALPVDPCIATGQRVLYQTTRRRPPFTTPHGTTYDYAFILSI
jgi:hypothetical protein